MKTFFSYDIGKKFDNIKVVQWTGKQAVLNSVGENKSRFDFSSTLTFQEDPMPWGC